METLKAKAIHAVLTALEGGAAGSDTERSTMLSPAQVGKALGVSGGYIRAAIRAGLLPAYRFGRCWRIAPADLERFVAQQRIGGTLALESTPSSPLVRVR